MYCTNCGKKLKEDEQYCTECGKQRENELRSQNSNTNISLILGIIACVFFLIPLISIPLAIISIMTGIAEKKEDKKIPIGIVLGVISIVLTIIVTIIMILLLIFAINTEDKYEDDYQKDDIIDKYNDIYNRQRASTDIKGYSWQATDQSTLYLREDNTYTWYQKEDTHDDNYTEGKYQTFQAEEAIDYIADHLEEFGITEEKQRNFFKNSKYDINNYYLLKITCEKSKINKEEKKDINTETYYYGFYNKGNQKLELINMSTAEKIILTRKEKISSIDV